jgi:hypothetical protein
VKCITTKSVLHTDLNKLYSRFVRGWIFSKDVTNMKRIKMLIVKKL